MRANDSPPDAPASPPASAHPPRAVDASAAGAGTAWGESVASGVLLPVVAMPGRVIRDGWHGEEYAVPVVYLTGPAINCSAEWNDHGEVMLVGHHPRYAAGALYEIAEAELVAYRETERMPELWFVTPDGDAIGLDEDQTEACGAGGLWKAWAA